MTRRALALLALLALGGMPARAQDSAEKIETLREHLMALEKESWDYMMTRDRAAMRRFLPDDAVLIFGGTRYNKDEMLDHVSNYRLDHYDIEPSYGMRVLSPDAAMLIYRVTSRGQPRFDRATTEKVLATSLYVRRNGRWRAVLYQETPSAAAYRENEEVTMPAGFSATSALPVDVMALREELVTLERSSWSFVRDRNYAAMSTYLADDALLIFDDGSRHDKHQMLERMKDIALLDVEIAPNYAARMLTSDIATLLYRVAYTSTIKSSRPETRALASSIYARRNGKWWSVLYQETPVK